jgi:hypothetical protein
MMGRFVLKPMCMKKTYYCLHKCFAIERFISHQACVSEKAAEAQTYVVTAADAERGSDEVLFPLMKTVMTIY